MKQYYYEYSINKDIYQIIDRKSSAIFASTYYLDHAILIVDLLNK